MFDSEVPDPDSAEPTEQPDPGEPSDPGQGDSDLPGGEAPGADRDEDQEAASALDRVLSEAREAVEAPSHAERGALPEPSSPELPGAAPRPPTPMDAERLANTAFLIELVGGLVGLLGLGYMYAGRTSEGITRLVVWLITVAVMWTIVGLLMIVLVGFCLLLPAIVLQVGVPVWSALALKTDIERQGASFN